MSFAAMSVISSCDEAFQLLTIDGDSYSAKLYKVEEMFNNEVVQTFTPSGPFKENGGNVFAGIHEFHCSELGRGLSKILC